MKESAKLYKVPKNRTVHTLSKRLTIEEVKADHDMADGAQAEKRYNLGNGKYTPVPVAKQ